MLEPVDGGLGVGCNFVETHPHHHRTPTMVADNPCFTALAMLDAGTVRDFTVKLLNGPTPAAYVLDG